MIYTTLQQFSSEIYEILGKKEKEQRGTNHHLKQQGFIIKNLLYLIAASIFFGASALY